MLLFYRLRRRPLHHLLFCGVLVSVPRLSGAAVQAAQPAGNTHVGAMPDALAPRIAGQPPSDAALASAEQAIRAEQFSSATASLTPFVQAHPESWRAHYDLGYALFRIRNGASNLEPNLRRSIRELARSLELHEANADAHKILALDLTMIQRDDLAGREFAEAVRLAPASAEVHYFLGRYLMRRGQYDNAASELRRTTELDPSNKKAFENLGITLARLGSPAAALEALQRAVSLDEQDRTHSEEPYLSLAHFYRDQNNTASALPLAQRATAINPHSEEAFLQLALACRAGQNWSAALKALQSAAALNPTTAGTQYLLGRTYLALGDRVHSRLAFDNFARLRRQQQPGAVSEPPGNP